MVSLKALFCLLSIVNCFPLIFYPYLGFIEMMSAYFPDFSRIDPAAVCSWIFQLESQLSTMNKSVESQNLSLKYDFEFDKPLSD